MRQLKLWPAEPHHLKYLESWRQDFPHAELNLPNGYSGQATVTLVADHDGELIESMTATMVMVIEAIIKNPSASPTLLAEASQRLEECLAEHAALNGAADSYIAVPDNEEMAEFHRVVRRRGYEPTAQGCTIYRRSLRAPQPEITESEVELDAVT